MAEQVRITIDCPDGDKRTFEGKTVIGVVLNEVGPDDKQQGKSFVVGSGSMRKDLIKAAIALGEVAKDTVNGGEAILLGGVMSKLLFKAAAGESDFIETILVELTKSHR